MEKRSRAPSPPPSGATVKLGAPGRFARGGGAKGAPGSALLRAPSSLGQNPF